MLVNLEGDKCISRGEVGTSQPTKDIWALFSLYARGSATNRASSGGRYLSMSKDDTEEFVAYTLHIPPTPDRRAAMSNSHSSFLEDTQNTSTTTEHPTATVCYIKDTIYTGEFNSVTRAHIVENSANEPPPPPKVAKSETLCGMKGCDEKAQGGTWKSQCECGFRIYRDCYLECVVSGEKGYCPGCKEPYKEERDDEPSSEE
ncbi:1,4-beta-D-xylan synthase [Sarracenia purpurea var. burkii]